jgi:hypothetical protein
VGSGMMTFTPLNIGSTSACSCGGRPHASFVVRRTSWTPSSRPRSRLKPLVVRLVLQRPMNRAQDALGVRGLGRRPSYSLPSSGSISPQTR